MPDVNGVFLPSPLRSGGEAREGFAFYTYTTSL
jgi:hypothetical protein